MEIALSLLAFLACRTNGPVLPMETFQLVVGLAPDWNSRTAVLYRFERTKNGGWRRIGKSWDANIGKNGLAVGRGLVDFCASEDERKKEGDKKAPAGVFPIGRSYAFGPGWRKSVRRKVTRLNDTMACIEDPASSHYNDIVDTASVTPDWEWMRPLKKPNGDETMSRVVVIGHNGGCDPARTRPEPDAGSCILFHVSRGPDRPTVGCTSIEARNIDALIAWLDLKKRPVYILLTKAQYRALAKDKKSGLPRIK